MLALHESIKIWLGDAVMMLLLLLCSCDAALIHQAGTSFITLLQCDSMSILHCYLCNSTTTQVNQ